MDETIQKLVAERRRALAWRRRRSSALGLGAVGRRHPQRDLLPGPAEVAGGAPAAAEVRHGVDGLRRRLHRRDAGPPVHRRRSRPTRCARSSARFGDVDRARFGWWLRGNGRYLIPGGMRDTLFAAALYLRNLLGTHIEIAIAASLVGMALAATNLLLWDAVFRAVDLNSMPPDTQHVRRRVIAALLVQAAHAVADAVVHGWSGPFIASIVLACAYWSVRDKPSTTFACWCRWRCGARSASAPARLGPMLRGACQRPALAGAGLRRLSRCAGSSRCCWVHVPQPPAHGRRSCATS